MIVSRHTQRADYCRRRSWHKRSAQRGIALITVLMVFAIATVIATKVIVAKNVDTQRVTGMVNRAQAYYYALAAEQLAILALMNDDEEDSKNSPSGDSLAEPWAARSIPFDIDNIGKVVVRILDLNRYYNINNLIQDDGKVNEHELARFKQLLTELDINEDIADNLADWLDSDDKEEGYASESDTYSQAEPAYLAANQRLTHVSELRLVTGFDREVMDKLLPHVCVISDWGVLPLNVNTATSFALATLQQQVSATNTTDRKGVGLTGARNIESNRPYESIGEFDDAKPIHSPTPYRSSPVNSDSAGGAAQFGKNVAHYTVDSSYYDIVIRASYGGHVSYLTSTVKRDEGGLNGSGYRVLRRVEKDNSHRFLE